MPLTEKSSLLRKMPPCRAACPAHVNVQAYVCLIQTGKFKEAIETIRKDLPFPATCGRVCFSPCETACSRVNVDQAVAIRYLKKFVADIERKQGRVKATPLPKKYDEKVAIIGAGPAGLTAAYELAKLGYLVTVFERMPELGGMMRYGIPDYRLEKIVVRDEIKYIEDLGVEFKTGLEFGKDITVDSLKRDGYRAIFIAIGAQIGAKLNVPGEDLEGVINAVDFLRFIALGKHIEVGERVAVVGGGNTAIDAARTAKRLGAREVMILYRRSREEMPAHPEEVERAERDGVILHYLVAPTRIIGENGRVKAVECIRMRLGEPDETGRRRPIPIPFTEHQYEVDTVIPAIGQVVDTTILPPEIVSEDGLIQVDPVTLETSIPGVFAGGDAVTGPASIIEAVAAGKRAAFSIHHYLRGLRLEEEKIEEARWIKNWQMLRKKPRLSFIEVEASSKRTVQTAKFEALRCLACGPCEECLAKTGLCDFEKPVVNEKLCIGCRTCVSVCPFGAMSEGEDGIAQVNVELCKGCGICSVNCPTNAIKMERTTREFIISQIFAALER